MYEVDVPGIKQEIARWLTTKRGAGLARGLRALKKSKLKKYMFSLLLDGCDKSLGSARWCVASHYGTVFVCRATKKQNLTISLITHRHCVHSLIAKLQRSASINDRLGGVEEDV